jgi:hypothetical protein
MSDKYKYVQNNHNVGIKVVVKIEDKETGGEKVFEKRFPIQAFDTNGREVETGYTRITEQEYNTCLTEGVFKYFVKKGKLLIHDTLPSQAMNPYEAIVSAKQETAARQAQLAEAQKENEKLRKELADANQKYADLVTASGKSVKKGDKMEF